MVACICYFGWLVTAGFSGFDHLPVLLRFSWGWYNIVSCRAMVLAAVCLAGFGFCGGF